MSKERGTKAERLKAWEKANPERARESHRVASARWAKEHPEVVKKRRAEQYKKHGWKHLERKKKWYIENTEKARESGRRWYKNNPEKTRAQRVKKAWGISLEEYDALIDKAGTTCPICGKSFGEIPPCIDHDHLTGEIRGVICKMCNSGMGFFRESVDVLLNAIEYLRKEGDYHGGYMVEAGV